MYYVTYFEKAVNENVIASNLTYYRALCLLADKTDYFKGVDWEEPNKPERQAINTALHMDNSFEYKGFHIGCMDS